MRFTVPGTLMDSSDWNPASGTGSQNTVINYKARAARGAKFFPPARAPDAASQRYDTSPREPGAVDGFFAVCFRVASMGLQVWESPPSQ